MHRTLSTIFASATNLNAALQLVSPFPREHYPTLWGWLQEWPESNLDDAAPKSADELAKKLIAAQQAGERHFLVLYKGQPVGAIGYARVSSTGAMFKGICFASRVHGTGIAAAAVSMVLDEIFQLGIQTIVAVVFADNLKVRWFLMKLGAEGVFAELPNAVRNGKQIRLRAYRIHADDFYSLQQPQVRQDVPNAAGVLEGTER